MPNMKITLEEPAWPELSGEQVVMGESCDVAVLDGGTESGKPSVWIRIDTEEGVTVLVETSARLFCATAIAIQARYPDLFTDWPTFR